MFLVPGICTIIFAYRRAVMVPVAGVATTPQAFETFSRPVEFPTRAEALRKKLAALAHVPVIKVARSGR